MTLDNPKKKVLTQTTAKEERNKEENNTHVLPPKSDKKKRHNPSENTKRRVLAVLSNPAVRSIKQVAQVLGISYQHAREAAALVKRERAELDTKLDEYCKTFREEGMAIRDRARRYKELAFGAKFEEQGMVILKTLERLDALDGIITKRELKETGRDEPARQPMFYLSGPSQVVVNMARDPRRVPAGQPDPAPDDLDTPQDVVVDSEPDTTTSEDES